MCPHSQSRPQISERQFQIRFCERIDDMTETFVDGLQVVVATKGREHQYLVAVTTRKKAATVVRKRLKDGWKATLTDKQITVRQAHKLNLRPNGACRWEPDTEAPQSS
jgi:phage replication-related protein YjqB (UPF0714/DUF867 family)